MRFPCVLSLLALFANTGSSWVQDTSRPLALPPLASNNTVFVQLQLVSLQSIDAASLSFTAGFYLRIAWRDDRYLTQQNLTTGGTFDPSPELVNAVGAQAMPLTYATTSNPPPWVPAAAGGSGASGWVVGSGMKRDQFTALIWLRKFPSDTQECPLLLESSTWNSSVLTWKFSGNASFDPFPLLEGASRNDFMTTTGWDLTEAGASSYTHLWAQLGEGYSRLRVVFKVARIPKWYNLRYVATLCVVVLIALAANVLKPSESLAALVACLGVIVAIMYVLAASSPPIPYATRVDQLLVSSIFLIFSLILFNGLEHVWDMHFEGEKSKVSSSSSPKILGLVPRDKDVYEEEPNKNRTWASFVREYYDLAVSLAHLIAFIAIVCYTMLSPCPACTAGEDAPLLL